MKAKPKVSVIVPIYNVEKYLDRCLKSILNQTYKNIEIILINDGSTDKSPKIAKKYAKLDNRILYISQSNKGLGTTRNIGIKKARTKYITFADSDDEVPIHAIESHMSNIEKTKCDISFGNIIHRYQNNERTAKPKLSNDYFKDILSLNIDVSSCNKIYKKSLFIKNDISFCENIFHEDYLPLFKLFYFAKKPSHIDKNTYIYYHINTNSITKNIGFQNVKDILIVFDLVYTFLSQRNIIDKYYFSFTKMICLILDQMFITHNNNKKELTNSSNFLIKEIARKKKIFQKKYFKKTYKNTPNRYTMFIYNLFVFINHSKYAKVDILNLPIYVAKKHINFLSNLDKTPLSYIINCIKYNNNQEIIVYGAGQIFMDLKKALKKTNVKILHIIDKKAEDKEFNFKGYKVKPKNSLLKLNANIPIIIASFAFADEIVQELENYKKENGLKNDIYDLHRCLNY